MHQDILQVARIYGTSVLRRTGMQQGGRLQEVGGLPRDSMCWIVDMYHRNKEHSHVSD